MVRKKTRRSKAKTSQPPEHLLRAWDATMAYGLPEQTLQTLLPEPAEFLDLGPGHRNVPCWRREDVEQLLETNAEAREAADNVLDRRQRRAEKELRKRLKQQATRYLSEEFGIDTMMRRAAFLQRRFILHIGPTNSGKTYDAMEALRNALSGTYLGPLRLLALEMFDKLNARGCRCNLLTGEERIDVDGAYHVASTIELCDYRTRYDVAVIDEAQMLADASRGAHWTRALLGVDAAEVHVCMAPEAQKIVTWLLTRIGAEFTVVEHKRLCPLAFSGRFGGWDDVRPGDGLITFSRRTVLSISAELEKRGIRASVIYGALPPESRREEVRKFASGETQVVVATDAIGMGISLPIRRIIFCATQKFDGMVRRPLKKVEIQQIAGRAGRYGIYDVGEVLSLSDEELIRRALCGPAPQIRNLTTPFPAEALASDYPLDMLLWVWQNLPPGEKEQKADLTDALTLLWTFDRSVPEAKQLPKIMVYELITCPVDTRTRELVYYWRDCVRAIVRDAPIPKPEFDTGTLEGCELQYKGFDIYSQLQRRMGASVSAAKEKQELASRINAFLAQDKQTLERRCPTCGLPLPFDWPYRVCDSCHYLHRMV